MASVSGLRGFGSQGGEVRADEVTRYVRDVAAFVPADVEGRNEALEEIEGHLRDAVAEYERQGLRSADAINRVLEEFGPASVIAAGFSDTTAVVRGVRGVRRWLPLALPLVSTVLALFVFGSVLARDGNSVGGQLAARWYARWLALDLALLAGAYYAIRRADRDRSWRGAAWACTLLLLVLPALH